VLDFGIICIGVWTLRGQEKADLSDDERL